MDLIAGDKMEIAKGAFGQGHGLIQHSLGQGVRGYVVQLRQFQQRLAARRV